MSVPVERLPKWLLYFSSAALLGAAQSNFQIAPPPIAHPEFKAGVFDGRFEPMLVSVESQQAELSLSGGGLSVMGRAAFSDTVALDVQGGLFVLTGTMPGIPPTTFPANYYPNVEDKADVTMSSFLVSFNLELQLFKADEGSLILFFGPNMGANNMMIRTPYSLVYYYTGQSYTGYTDTVTVSSSMAGAQYGMQAGLNLGQGVRFSPFFMVSSTSGTATLEENPGTSNGTITRTTADIPEFTTTSYGMDIIIDQLSIGTVLQSIQSQDEGSNDIDIVMFRFGFRF